MENFRTSSQQLINALFGFLNNLEGVVFWACTPDYKKQLFVNNAYEEIWGRTKEELQSNFSIWAETLVKDDLLKNMNEFKRRMITPDASSMGFRIARPDSELRYIRNTSFTLYDKDNQPSLILGVDENLNPQRWDEWLNTNSEEKIKVPFLQEFISIFQKEGGLQLTSNIPQQTNLPNVVHIMDQPVTLTNREQECLTLVLSGKSAKQIAYELNISVRTAELHISHIRQKTNCRTKFELLRKIRPVNG